MRFLSSSSSLVYTVVFPAHGDKQREDRWEAYWNQVREAQGLRPGEGVTPTRAEFEAWQRRQQALPSLPDAQHDNNTFAPQAQALGVGGEGTPEDFGRSSTSNHGAGVPFVFVHFSSFFIHERCVLLHRHSNASCRGSNPSCRGSNASCRGSNLC